MGRCPYRYKCSFSYLSSLTGLTDDFPLTFSHGVCLINRRKINAMRALLVEAGGPIALYDMLSGRLASQLQAQCRCAGGVRALLSADCNIRPACAPATRKAPARQGRHWRSSLPLRSARCVRGKHTGHPCPIRSSGSQFLLASSLSVLRDRRFALCFGRAKAIKRQGSR